jgi:hypothetical protein
MATDWPEPNAAATRVTADSEAALQEELRREAAERDTIGGDTATDRHLSGSSTWVTLPDAPTRRVSGREAPTEP